jgi:hypothetical protein
VTLWGTRFGNVYASTGSGALGMGDVLAGSPRAGGAMPPAAAVVPDSELTGRLERHILEERAKDKDKRANSLILVQAKAAESAQAFVGTLLEKHAARWKLAEIAPGARGVTLVYLARLEGTAQGTVVDRLREGANGAVEEVELRSLKGIKPRE